MKKIQILGVILAAFLVPGLAMATHIEDLVGSADCDGWNAEMSIVWRTGIYEGTLDYAVILLDDQNNEVVRDEWSGALDRGTDYPDEIFTYGGTWDLELCGDYTVIGTFHVVSPYGDGLVDESTMEFTAAFSCICDEPGDCYLTPGYWKNHAENWPTTTLTVGGVEMGQDELLAILRAPVRGDATVILAHHLIAAKLNVLNNGDVSINGAIEDADDYLALHAIFSRPGQDDGRADALLLKNLLCTYNEQGCEGEDDNYDGPDGKSFGSSTESTTWDQMKAQYR